MLSLSSPSPLLPLAPSTTVRPPKMTKEGGLSLNPTSSISFELDRSDKAAKAELMLTNNTDVHVAFKVRPHGADHALPSCV